MSLDLSKIALLSVEGLNSYIQELLEEDSRLQQIWVIGEVSSASEHRSGLFFTLGDPQGDAAIRCVVWNSRLSTLIQPPIPGEQLLVLGSMKVYPKRGEYQLNVFQAIAAGAGIQALRSRQLRDRLQAEGLFDPERKRRLPLYPQTISVVTSPTAAAWGDIQRTLTQRYPGLNVIFSPATVQGVQAPDSIAAAIERVNRDGRAEVLILARGGGSVEDLSCFNDERVVRAIVGSAIPVVTGIGHQRDESLADLVADFSAHTPTAAAETVVPMHARLVAEHRQRKDFLIEAFQQKLAEESGYLRQISSRLKALPSTSRSLAKATALCQILRHQLVALDPKAVLQRGYALVRRNDKTIVNSVADLVVDRELMIQFDRGSLKVRITEILDE